MAFDRKRRWLSFTLLLAVVACGASGFRKFPPREPIWRDPDQQPFRPKPDEYFSPFGWDAADQTIFRPVARFFAVDPTGAACNVNALDEVPDSSWFVNRIGRYQMLPGELADAPCSSPELDPQGPFEVVGAKPNGDNPGFVIKASDGRRFLLKFDGLLQGERATAADVIGSRIYHAAGYFVPCNDVVYFDRSALRIANDARTENAQGDKKPLTMRDVDLVLAKGLRAPDGRYRANSSLFLAGKPLGPWTYQGTRGDDPNDVIPHEDRRELRGMRLLAAWTNHFDAREQNTLGMFIAMKDGRGYVRHNVLDFGDCFGSIWEPPMLGRRIGHAYYLDFGYVAEDFISFGIVRRPWDKARFGPSGTVFGYFDAELFDAEKWRPGYPNPAFGRMDEHDAAWMARIIARFEDAHVRALVKTAKFLDPSLEDELTRILIGRRNRILQRYLALLSPLADPVVIATGVNSAALCLSDLAVASHVSARSKRSYAARAWLGDALLAPLPLPVQMRGAATACVALPNALGEKPATARYLVVDFDAHDPGRATGPARVHLYRRGAADYRVVGLERPDAGDVSPL